MRELEHAAREFEGILLASVWQAWNKSDRMGNLHDPINDSMTGMGIEMASMAIAQKGGIGIAQMIVKSLQKEVTGQTGR
jgi:Rod binding domain-containing protein